MPNTIHFKNYEGAAETFLINTKERKIGQSARSKEI